ncbi:GNAT family N-acetyltransferase [Nocardioides sp. zg-579]|uniref:GNAT family N-acetyltransferase n=1 Tax=Nocardioides marmotae TaxID=2663857 RepID=A0A6I3IXL6_9ACTN|nr:GNAT family N-acetyltransferase [Nocardioides marmotae]MCR6030205.1 GNAT family N-acetyltransferase [Gordonia jinghuaiqii]MTB93837.1 GNAT family N-acetyltransferase [Nocardioides marmotae]QKE03314.1 GNAT family N-acetyltransferase [Nocardioides marmotae]
MIPLDIDGHRFGIDRAVEADVPALVALLADDLLGAGRESLDLAPYLAAFREIDRDPNQLLVAVRNADGAVAGTLQLTLIPGLARQGAKRLQIEAVRLASSARGIGLGTALFAWAHRYAREHGATLAQLTTDKARSEAHRFYEALGYRASHEGYKLRL